MTPCPKCEKYRKALEYIVSHAWVVDCRGLVKWINEFVYVAQQALKDGTGQKE